MAVQCRPAVFETDLYETLTQHWVNVSCLLDFAGLTFSPLSTIILVSLLVLLADEVAVIGTQYMANVWCLIKGTSPD